MYSTQQTQLAPLNGQGFSMEDIAQKVRVFVVDNLLFGQGDDRFSNDDSFLENGLIDSVGILTLVEFVRETYAISIQDEELVPENWDSVHRIAAFVQTKLKSQPS
jgi:acyl carrier protein